MSRDTDLFSSLHASGGPRNLDQLHSSDWSRSIWNFWSISTSASVAFLSQIKPFVEPIKRGAELLLFNGSNAELEIGLARTDTVLKEGSLIVTRVAKGAIDLRELTLDRDDFRLLGPAGRPVDAFPYMVLGVERLQERDFAKIPDLRQGWEGVRLAAQEGRPDAEIAERFGQLRRTIFLSPDLVPTHRKRIVAALAKELAEAGCGTAAGLESAPLEEALSSGRVLRDLAEVVRGTDDPASPSKESSERLTLETAPFRSNAVPIDSDAALESALADREAEEVEAETAAMDLEAVVPVPPNVAARVSPRIYDLIVRHETGGRAYYEQKIKKRPVWPRGSSGITIGFGYDLGYVKAAEFARDWSLLDAGARDALASCLGVHAGEASETQMLSHLGRVKDIVIEWEAAEAVFKASTLPKFVSLTWQALPNSDRLNDDSFGALVSLTFNRGASFSRAHDPAKDPKDRYREMGAIKAAMQRAEFAAIPAQIRAMKRVWLGTAIETEMTRRRENEAAAFEAGLAAMPMAALTGAARVPTGAGLEAAELVAIGSSGAIPPDVDAWTGASDEDFWTDTGENEASTEAARSQRPATDQSCSDFGAAVLSKIMQARRGRRRSRTIDRTTKGLAAFSEYGTGCRVGSWFIQVPPRNLLPTGLYRYIFGPHVTSKSRPGCFLLRKTLSEKRVVVVRRSRDAPRHEQPGAAGAAEPRSRPARGRCLCFSWPPR